MTAMRTTRFWGIALAAGLWLAAAALLWRTDVPDDLALPELDPAAVFGERHVTRSGRYERFLRANWVMATLVELAVLAAVTWFAPRLRLRRLVGGVALAAGTFVLLFVAALPFVLASHWWRRRYGISSADYSTILLDPWLERLGSLVAACAAVGLFMLLARRLGDRWWLVGGSAFAVVAAAYLLAQPLLLTPRVEPLRDARLVAEIHRLADEQGVGEVEVEVKDASRRTRALNAEFYGVGPSQRIVLWDTALDGRLSRRELHALVAHELGHVEARHLWKGVAWVVLFAIPGAYVVARATRRRGGLGEPAAVPLALLTLALLQLALLPVANAVSRRYEREADWLALRATRDPAAAEGLMVELARAALAQPDPPAWARVLLETHPTPLDRVRAARAPRAEAFRGGS
jgi:STE24 endopeptidase